MVPKKYKLTQLPFHFLFTFLYCLQVVTPVVNVPKTEPSNGSGDNDVDTLAVGATHQLVAMSSSSEGPQILQVLSLKDAAALTKALSQQPQEMKQDDTIIGD